MVQVSAIEVAEADMRGERMLRLRHKVQNAQMPNPIETRRTLALVKRLWGYRVEIDEVDETDHKTLATYTSGFAL